MAELVWRGKNPPAEQPIPALRTIETLGVGAWHNRLIEGDRALVLRALLPEFAGRVGLIYIDPFAAHTQLSPPSIVAHIYSTFA